ncbi:MAG: DivIVA domain-containing protein [Desulfocapsaceae bacterium]|jgi:DivIVA domain-containing protein|nr:DivIVA domain-containing protein [Desulfocapsaceae bacterium]
MSTTPQMITPQIIKDQEFQSKFRGYDPVEVKAYLDLIAEEFFDLQERCRLQIEDLQASHEEKEIIEQQKISFEASSAESRKMAEELRQAGLQMEQKLAAQAKELEGFRSWITNLEREKKGLEEALSDAEERIRKAEKAVVQEKVEKEALARKIELMEEQQRDAKKDEVDFRSTLAAAQQFCDAMKEKSKEQAGQLLDATRGEIEQIRAAAHAELSRLPGEIAALQQKREEVRKVLRATLETYLQNLDIFHVADENSPERENDDLFQKIQILEDGSLNPEELAALNMDIGVVSHADGENDLLSVFGGDEVSGDQEDDEKI